MQEHERPEYGQKNEPVIKTAKEFFLTGNEMIAANHFVAGRQICQSSDSYKELQKIWNEDIDLRERFIVLYLNKQNKVHGFYTVSIGGIDGTVVDVKMCILPALRSMSSGMILAHNHPSNNLRPSQADIKVTKKIKEAAKFFDIALLDHIIMTPDSGYFSFADEGMI
tara:strand:+ start:70 stop:570 length:501 start_codon:yes stop_codon:yes gene_type:complete